MNKNLDGLSALTWALNYLSNMNTIINAVLLNWTEIQCCERLVCLLVFFFIIFPIFSSLLFFFFLVEFLFYFLAYACCLVCGEMYRRSGTSSSIRCTNSMHFYYVSKYNSNIWNIWMSCFISVLLQSLTLFIFALTCVYSDRLTDKELVVQAELKTNMKRSYPYF